MKAGRRDQACKDAIEALRSAAQFEGAAKVIRLCERCDGQRFWIMVKGRWDKPEEGSKRPPGFFRSYQIAAPNLQAAIELARAQEPPAVRASVALEEVKKFGPFPMKYGILFRSGRAFFPEP